jgi:hypothetical protein
MNRLITIGLTVTLIAGLLGCQDSKKDPPSKPKPSDIFDKKAPPDGKGGPTAAPG